jgi:hypothetical protein
MKRLRDGKVMNDVLTRDRMRHVDEFLSRLERLSIILKPLGIIWALKVFRARSLAREVMSDKDVIT